MKKPTIADVLAALAGFAEQVERRFDRVDQRMDDLQRDVREVRHDLLGAGDEHARLKRRVEKLEERAFGSVQS